MKERASWPMKAHEVRAILNGSKTQVRLVVKPQPEAHQHIARHLGDGDWQFVPDLHILAYCVSTLRCPYGQPGDRLWVRETWYCDDFRVQRGPYLKPDDMDLDEARADGTMVYRASSGDRPYEAEQPVWRPAIHMPRWASRITLEVTGVSVERLQDISEADAISEGIEKTSNGFWSLYGQASVDGTYSPRASYRALWESINGPGSWDANPWVWVVEFKRVTP